MVADVVRGAVAGLVGTAVMTGAQTAEMRVTGRAPSTVPGEVASKLLGLKPADGAELTRISLRMHWAHGMTQGVVRALIGRRRSGLRATAAHFVLMWSSDAVFYRVLGISPWPWEWSADELAPDVGHKGLYAVVTGVAYDRMS